MNLGASTELTIASGVITATKGFHTVDTQGDGAADDLVTINGGATGDILVLSPEHSVRNVTVKDGTGNILLGSDYVFANTGDTLVLIKFASGNWARLGGNLN